MWEASAVMALVASVAVLVLVPRRTNACASGNQGRADHLPQGFRSPCRRLRPVRFRLHHHRDVHRRHGARARRRSPPSSPTSS
ncbi:MAG: hypothetical protein WDN31_08790 [Hyphomicrobium sp.]